MRILLFILLLSGGSAFAGPDLVSGPKLEVARSSCESLLHPREAELADLVHQMHVLKQAIFTPEIEGRLKQLNQRALAIISEQLTLKGIKHKIVPGFEPANHFIRRDLRNVPLLSNMRLARMNASAQALIAILADPNHPPGLQDLAAKLPHIDVLLSPEWMSVNPEISAFTRGPKLFMSLEEIFADNFGDDSILAHEVLHLEHEELFRLGIETPYNIRVTRVTDEPLQTVIPGFYDDSMTFDELAAWDQDLQAYAPGKPYFPYRRFSKGKVYQRLSREGEEYFCAKGLSVLNIVASEALLAIADSLQNRVAEIEFDYDDPVAGRVTIPWYRGTARFAKIVIDVIGLTTENQERRFELLNGYLERVTDAVALHRRNGMAVLNKYPEPPDLRWKVLN